LADKPKIGVLALQGNFHAHCNALERAGAEATEVRTARDLQAIDGLIIPGGESTTMLKLLDEENLFEPLRKFGEKKPIFGTCAGAILLASEVLNPVQRSLGLMDLTVERNAYGRQIDSRIAQIDLGSEKAEAVFIRAPVIRRTGPGTKVLATYLGDPVLVQHGKHMVATFHPELSNSNVIHAKFIQGIFPPSVGERKNSGGTEKHGR
jgi:pyridoxal 5'-phosphate synthase pdxT subunit